MAQESPSTGGSGTGPGDYADQRAPQFVGGSFNPSTGAVVPSSKAQADVAPPPALPTTQLAQINPPTSKLAPTVGSYLGSSIGGEFGGQVAGGASLGDATTSTLQNIGTTLKEPIAANEGDLASLAASGGSTVAAAAGSALGSAAGAGVFTAAIGAATGEKPAQYLPQAAGSAVGVGVGTFLGSILGGPIGGAIGGAIGGYAGGALKPVQTFFRHLFNL